MDIDKHHSPVGLPQFKERLAIFTLAAIQFTHMVDFVIIMPLGPQFMRVFSIGSSEFGLLVSSYTFSAGLFGLFGAFFVDKFDRKSLLLFTYSGFTIGTFFCSIATNFHFLLSARVVAGAFAGILWSTILAIIGDIIPDSRRGRATGTVMSAFSVASIVGIPIGLFFANSFGWSFAFSGLSVISFFVLILSWYSLPSVKGHIVKTDEISPIRSILNVLQNSNHYKAFFLTTTLMFGGFSVIPYISPYMVSNVKIAETDLPYIYFFGGVFTFFTSQLIGRFSDRFGKVFIFKIVAAISIIPIVLITNLPVISLFLAISVTTVFMIFVSGRFVPALALINSVADPKFRGSFMSVNSSVQQLTAGLASSLAGFIIITGKHGLIKNYDKVGYVSIVATILSLFIAGRMKK
ncbi:MAG: MFS transporter [Leptospiraceae bacterium]|nr:MFS transporter [Leptospiraceae bacterium]MCK6381130.1 MFS transporter [Leptospiraceae bacterium]NUM40580.1 MFS transporter [Leptospiraceae bacterium]